MTSCHALHNACHESLGYMGERERVKVREAREVEKRQNRNTRKKKKERQSIV